MAFNPDYAGNLAGPGLGEWYASTRKPRLKSKTRYGARGSKVVSTWDRKTLLRLQAEAIARRDAKGTSCL